MDQTTPTQSIEPESVDAAAANQEIVSLFSRELVSVRAKLRDADRVRYPLICDLMNRIGLKLSYDYL
jgi:hypothetical protein